MEVHYHCAPLNEGTTKKCPAPLWLLDLSATVVSDSDRQKLMTEITNQHKYLDYFIIDITEDTSYGFNQQGGYILIPDIEKEEKLGKENNILTLIVV